MRNFEKHEIVLMFNSSSCDYPVSVVLELSAKPSRDCLSHLAGQSWFGRRFKNHSDFHMWLLALKTKIQ